MNGIIRIVLSAAAMTLMPLLLVQNSLAHCQIPCGIYDDHARVALMLEDVATIHKAVSQIADLAARPIRNRRTSS